MNEINVVPMLTKMASLVSPNLASNSERKGIRPLDDGPILCCFLVDNKFAVRSAGLTYRMQWWGGAERVGSLAENTGNLFNGQWNKVVADIECVRAGVWLSAILTIFQRILLWELDLLLNPSRCKIQGSCNRLVVKKSTR